MSWWLWTIVGAFAGLTLEALALVWMMGAMKAKMMPPKPGDTQKLVGGIPMRRQ